MEISHDVEAGTATIALAGDLDAATAYLPYERAVMLFDEPAPPHTVIVDLNGVEFADSTGLGALIRIRELAESRHASCLLRGVQPALGRVLTMTGLDRAFTFA